MWKIRITTLKSRVIKCTCYYDQSIITILHISTKFGAKILKLEGQKLFSVEIHILNFG